MIKCLVVACIGILVVVGCSDNPQNEAAKQLGQSAEKVLDMVAREGDFEKAAKAMQAALRDAPQAGSAAEPVRLAIADLTFEQAQRQQSKPVAIAGLANMALDDISLEIRSISRLQIQQDRLNNLLGATEKEIEGLSKSITGDSQSLGIEGQLAGAAAALSQLEEFESELEQRRQKAQSSIDSIQQSADEKLRLAEGLRGDEKLELAQAGYDILLTRTNYFLDAQEALDQIQSIESQIAILEPLVQKLESDLISVQQQISDIRSSPASRDSKAQLGDVIKQIDEHSGRIAWVASDLKEAQATYGQAVDETISLFQQAADEYKKVRSQSARKAAAVGLADSYGQIAVAALDGMRFQWYFSSRLLSIASTLETQTANALGEVASQYASGSADYAQRAKDSFDIAIGEYSKLQKRFASGRDEFACDVLKNYILALYGKMVVSEYLAEQDVVDEVLAQADELIEKARNCDPGFARSVTARLLAGSAEFVPSMAIDSTMYYTELKKEFQAWKAMRGEDKEAEVNKLLAMLDGMGEPEDLEVFKRMIGPERQQLEAALARGFKEELGAGEGGEGAESYDDYGDPNYF
ncbi:MAG: hypothetical protein ACYS6I_04720 [Planctomycetota bacterium]